MRRGRPYAKRFSVGLGELPGIIPAPAESRTINPAAIELPIRLFPPINWENIDVIAYVALPAINSEAVILQFIVPIGRNGIINKVANNFVGGGWTEGTGDLIWRILADGAPPPGATTYQAIPASLGSPANPVPISGFRIFENQRIQVTVFNNPAGPNGGVVLAGQQAGARLCGYLYPRELEDPDIWI
jgi:hypothetical protein